MQSASLKAYAAKLAEPLGMTELAIYERQRMLARTELIDLGERGRNRGTRASADHVALLIIAALSTESLSRSEARVRELIDAEEINPPEDSPFRGHRKFGKALAFVLTQPAGLARHIVEIGVSRTCGRAWIRYRVIASRTQRVAEFVKGRAVEPPLRVMATLDGKVIAQIAADVRAMLLNIPDPLFGSEAALQRPEPST
jgi:hypothetical protein